MPSEETAGGVRGWQRNTVLAAVIWDGAPSHRSPLVLKLGFPLVQQPTYAPELNPMERLIEELRRAVEAKLCTSLEQKVAAIEAELRKRDANSQIGSGSRLP